MLPLFSGVAIALALLVPVLSVYVIGSKQALGEIRDRVQSLLSQLEEALRAADDEITDADLQEAQRCFTLAATALDGPHRPRPLRAAEQWARRGLAVLDVE